MSNGQWPKKLIKRSISWKIYLSFHNTIGEKIKQFSTRTTLLLTNSLDYEWKNVKSIFMAQKQYNKFLKMDVKSAKVPVCRVLDWIEVLAPINKIAGSFIPQGFLLTLNIILTMQSIRFTITMVTFGKYTTTIFPNEMFNAMLPFWKP